ncbi:helix-turn-helix domain-containing protein [Antribacter sp. KLBMP9083]|uniref:Helix-turn-helix domain-containing protein n=1 Tax=Antribacter soli TaxID=2910976 RepID=A0AA41U8J8_9MICO|nr:helix-turn-helix domain-containing protein [Antribacter soli]MCF4120557.1 helix-turn-helix domain-containing protein [Antribacter soli]
MRDLTIRLAALDPGAADAMRVISYFDALVEHHAGLSAVVRGAAVLSGFPAGLADERRHLRIRVLPDGTSGAAAEAGPDPAWLSTPPSSSPVLWIECRDDPTGLHTLILERARLAVESLDRTRPSAPDSADEGRWATVVVDPQASPEARVGALQRLGLNDKSTACAVAMLDGPPVIFRTADLARQSAGDRRAGVGPVVPALELPRSWEEARLALRLSAEGTSTDPGERVVLSSEAGGLLALARSITSTTPVSDDVVALDRVATTAPPLLETLHAISVTSSLRDAATSLHMHHSTVQERASRAERVLGWSITSPNGRFRLQLAFALRRLHRAEATVDAAT